MTTSQQLGMTVEDSTPRLPRVVKPAEGAPNVVVILFDDLGFAQLGCFGSDIDTPNIDRLATRGLRYNGFHVTAICSSTRASLLTGRNHHAVGMGFLVDAALAFPGYNGRIPTSAAGLPRLLRDAGYNTFAVGKWHLVPRGERSEAGPFDRWPLGMGFERYYGFLLGATNHWTPSLVSDNHYVEPPSRPEDGYHLTEDLADTAAKMIIDQQNSAPGKPFCLYFSLGATHSPHHVAQEWVDPYRGRFDDGWDRWRDAVFARQLDMQVVPEGTILTKRPPWVSAWKDIGADARRIHVRAQEVYAGFLTHTDAQIGRLLGNLDRLGVLDNTLVLLMSDNGASAEGGQLGNFNDLRFSARLGETVEDSLARLDDWGGFRSHPHYSWAWAWAGNTPFKLWKRYTWLGGTRTPLIMHWPAGIQARGEVRNQFCHAVDILPTILDACGVETPEVIDGVTQQPLDGVSLAPSFDAPEAPTRKTQYFEMLGSRSIIHGNWKATTDHVAQGVADEEELMIGSREFEADHWALFDLAQDFSEAIDISDQHPEIVHRLQELWWFEAGRNNVLPMSSGFNRVTSVIPPAYPPSNRAVFRPGGSHISVEALPALASGFEITVDANVPVGGPKGVLFALGDWNGGMAFYGVDGRIRFTFCPADTPITVVSNSPISAGRHRLSVTFTPSEPSGGQFLLACDGTTVGSGDTTKPLPFAMLTRQGKAHLYLGYDQGFPVCDDYLPPAPWEGEIHEMTVDGLHAATSDETDLREALHAD